MTFTLASFVCATLSLPLVGLAQDEPAQQQATRKDDGSKARGVVAKHFFACSGSYKVVAAPITEACTGPFAGGVRPTFEALDRILTTHREWLDAGRPDGDARRADLCGADLTNLAVALGPDPGDLAAKFLDKVLGTKPQESVHRTWSHPPDLSYANLRYANLSNANLRALKLVSADLTGATLTGVQADKADLAGACLRQANLNRARFVGAKLSYADHLASAEVQSTNFEEADLSFVTLPLDLSGVRLAGALLDRATLCSEKHTKLYETALMGSRIYTLLDSCDFTGAMLWSTDFSGSWLKNVVFTNADLRDANFNGAHWDGVNLSGAKFRDTNLEDVEYDHSTDGAPDLASIRAARNLQGLLYRDSPRPLLELRDRFYAAGMREQERMVNFAVNRARRLREQNWIESAFNYVLFELPVGYGLYPGRPLKVIALLIPVFGGIYFFAVRFPGKDGVWREWNRERVRKDIGSDVPEHLQGGTFISICFGLYFSVLSAFHIGWRDLNIGSWIVRVQPNDYVLRGSGWVRAVSGVQSLLSVYLLALWLLSYFGRPFLG